MSQIQTLSSVLTGGTTVTVVAATVLVVLAVVVPRWRRTASLPAAVLALIGAIAARFTQTNTAFGDEIFRGSTVLWSLGLAVVCVIWWLAADGHTNRQQPPADEASVGGDFDVPARGAGATALLERPAPPRRRTAYSPGLVVIGAASLLVAVCTFLTATGIYPVGLATFSPS